MDDDACASDLRNLLLRSAHDSAEGYRQGAALARNPEFQSLFRERLGERERLIQTLEREARASGAEPAREGSILGEAHRLFTFARDMLNRGSDKALIEELVRREHEVARSFEYVANDSQTPEPTRTIASEALKQMVDEAQALEGLSAQFQQFAKSDT